jgi:hypothetical protein
MTARALKLRTEYDPKPVPTDAFDWSAVLDDYDGAPDASSRCRAVGYGPTEKDAIADLLEAIDEVPETAWVIVA